MTDMVNHPKHYTSHPSGIEAIEITRHFIFSIGNAIKYLWRAGLKEDATLLDKEKEIEDLEKAVWYIQDRINQLKEEVTGDDDWQFKVPSPELTSSRPRRATRVFSLKGFRQE